MTSYTKFLLAVIIAFVATAGAFMWFQKQGNMNSLLRQEIDELRNCTVRVRQMSETSTKLQVRLQALEQELNSVTNKFASKLAAGISLMQGVINAAGISGIKIQNAVETSITAPAIILRNAGVAVDISAYEISMRGTYTSIVKFLQKLAKMQIIVKIDSLHISSDDETDKTGILNVQMVVYSFSLT